MSNHRKEGGIAELVGPLLKRLKLAKERVPENLEMENSIDQIIIEVKKIKDILDSREILDKKLAGYFGKIERQIDPWINDKPHEKASQKASDLTQKGTITEVGESSNTIPEKPEKVIEFLYFINLLKPDLGKCLKCLSIFPENTELKKRLVIYWWMALFLNNTEYYESFISNLVKIGVLIPIQREHNKVIDRFTIEPTVHKWLINSERYGHFIYEEREEGTWGLYANHVHLNTNIQYTMMMLLNLNQRYLNSKDIMDISSKHNLDMVQLGSWRYTETEIQETGYEETNLNDHIEVDQTDFLKKLRDSVAYLSLRGISGITELHESIGKLGSLTILDLRACHNLEKLPQKPKSNVWFGKLSILDISGCYLLDHTPKWICELSNLKVLKGFVVGSSGNKNQSCQLSDLWKLYKLRKLSIRIPTDSLHPEVFEGFNYRSSLRILTITWGENKYKEIPTYSLPEFLEKLDIRCYPGADASKLKNPEDLKYLKRLYIRGGNLTKIPCHDNWRVKILRLRFLKKLVPTDWNEIRRSFSNLKYVEYVGCPKPENFPNKAGNSWREEDDLRQLMINLPG